MRLEHENGEQRDEAAVGDGPIDATFKALERATEMSVELIHFDVRSVTMGEDAQGEATVTARWGEFSYRGRAVSTDIVEAGAEALLEVLNRALRAKARTSSDKKAIPGARRRLGAVKSRHALKSGFPSTNTRPKRHERTIRMDLA